MSIKTSFEKIKNYFSAMFSSLMQAEKFAAFLATRRKHMVVALVSIGGIFILVLCGNFIYKSQQEKYSTILHESLIAEEKGDIFTAQENLKSIYEASFAPKGVKALASIRYGAILLNTGKMEEALKVFQTVSKKSSYNDFVRETAALLAARILTADLNKNSDEATKEAALEYIEKMVKNCKILRYEILQQKGLYFLKVGENKKAAEIFETIAKSPDAPDSTKSSSGELLKLTTE